MRKDQKQYRVQRRVAQHNAATVSSFQAKLEEIRSSGLLRGILPPDAKHIEGHIYLRGEGVLAIAGSLTRSGAYLKALHGEASIYTDSFACGPGEAGKGCEVARVCISRLCFRMRSPSDSDDTWPGADEIASCIYEHIERQTDQDFLDLYRIRRELDDQLAVFRKNVKIEPWMLFKV